MIGNDDERNAWLVKENWYLQTQSERERSWVLSLASLIAFRSPLRDMDPELPFSRYGKIGFVPYKSKKMTTLYSIAITSILASRSAHLQMVGSLDISIPSYHSFFPNPDKSVEYYFRDLTLGDLLGYGDLPEYEPCELSESDD